MFTIPNYDTIVLIIGCQGLVPTNLNQWPNQLPTAEKSTKEKRGKAKLVQDKKKAPTPQDSPAMCTRTKVDYSTPESLALCTRSKRKLDV